MLQLWAVVTHGKVVPQKKGKGKQGKGEKARGNTRGREKAKLAKAGGRIRKEKDKERDSKT